MPIKVNQNGKWVNVYGSSIEVKRNVSLDKTLTKKGWAAEAQSVGKQIGDITDLNTTNKNNLVSAINEVALNAGSGAQLSIIRLNDQTQKSSHTRDEILALIEGQSDEDVEEGEAKREKQLVLGCVESTGEVLTFVGIDKFQTDTPVAIFENTRIDQNGKIVTSFYNVDYYGNISTPQYYHNNPIDEMVATVGQVAVVAEVDKINHRPIKWKAANLEKAENGIIVVNVGNSSADKSSTDIQACLDKGQFVYALYKDQYYPFIKIENEIALFYLTEINANTAKGHFLSIGNDKTYTHHQESMAQLDYIPNPSAAAPGQVLTVAEINDQGIATKWVAQNIVIPDEYTIPLFNLKTLYSLPAIIPDGEIVTVSNEEMDTANILLALNEGPIRLTYDYEIDDVIIEVTSVTTSLSYKVTNEHILTCIDHGHAELPILITFVITPTSIEAFAKIISSELLNAIPLPDTSLSTAGQVLSIKSIDENGKIEWETVDLPEGGSGNYEIPNFDLINFTATTTYRMRSVPASSISIVPNGSPAIVVTDTTAIMAALANSPINIKFEYVLSDEETLTTNAIINPIYFQEKNMFMAGLIDYVNNTPCFVFFTFEENKITGQAKTLNEELKLDATLTKEGQAADSKAVGDAINSILPAYTVANLRQYLTPNNEGVLIWTNLHLATKEYAGVVHPEEKTDLMTTPVGIDASGKLWVEATKVNIDTTLTKEGFAADAKVVGDALQTINSTSSKTYIINYDLTTQTLDKTYNEIVTAIDNGYMVILKYHTLTLYLVQKVSNFISFAISSGKNNVMISIDENNTVTISDTSLKIATPEVAGLVQPLTKTEEMIAPVGIDETGKLWSKSAEVDKTITQSGQAADAAAVRAELDNILELIQNISISGSTGGLIVEDDDRGNVEVIAIPPSWSIFDDGEGNIVITSALAILPSVTEENNGQFMRVIDGQWSVATIDTAENNEF